ncbi:MAG: hypothetical protein NZ959_11655, partial [Armatimonadetes bacterium]|nr:hypothetical protein [Armatimonadota bacterium]MDW8122984.1 glycoside hydrolase family 38 C-terminal domain-containing protein [Armatimonadota bacterium]
MGKVKEKEAVVVPHTHWDRAWYLPFERFRIRLVRLTGKLLSILKSDPNFRFTFDGQTVVLDDVLEIRPDWEGALRKYVTSGNVSVGPWYILPDEFLVSGEAIVRNLLIGHRIAQRFGACMKVGYIPDPFGHIAQLPQILNGFNLDTFVFMRGMGDEGEELGSEFWWVAPDGVSKVLAHHQITSYCNAAHLGYVFENGVPRMDYERATEHLKRIFSVMDRYATAPVYLISNGCDHLEPQPEIPELLQYLNSHFEGVRFVLGTPADFFEKVRKSRKEFKTYQGELRGGRYHYLLPGVFSSRIYLKQANFRCQRLLERWVEPFCALSHFVTGSPYPSHQIIYAWKTLLKNQPHDDICGCSVDEVHREDVIRFQLVEEVGEDLLSDALNQIASRIQTPTSAPSAHWSAFAVFNPLPWTRSDPVSLTVPNEWLEKKGIFVTDDGSPCAFQVIGAQDNHSLVLVKPKEVPSVGYRTLYFDQEANRDINWATDVQASNRKIENEFLQVTVAADGTISVTDKMTGRTLSGLNYLESTEDAGDEYDYSPAENTQTITSKGVRAKVRLAEKGPVRATLEISYDLLIPESLTPDRKSRSSKKIKCPVVIKASLTSGIPRVDFEVTVTNNAQDHRLRAVFPTDVVTEVAKVEEHYHIIERPLTLPEGKDWVQAPVPTNHQEQFVSVDDGDKGVTVINEGLPEYEVAKGDKGVTIYLTLLRCVGWLSRGDFKTRRGNAGPSIPTPEAQCQGTYRFRYSLVLHKGNWRDGNVLRLATEHNVPMRLVPARRPDQKHPEGTLPVCCSFVTVQPPDFYVTAIKKAEDRNSLIVRFYNTNPHQSVSGAVSLWKKIKRAFTTNMNEDR